MQLHSNAATWLRQGATIERHWLQCLRIGETFVQLDRRANANFARALNFSSAGKRGGVWRSELMVTLPDMKIRYNLKASNVLRILGAKVRFTRQLFVKPWQLSSVTIHAIAEAHALDSGARGWARGRRARFDYLSGLWDWPDPALSHETMYGGK